MSVIHHLQLLRIRYSKALLFFCRDTAVVLIALWLVWKASQWLANYCPYLLS